MSSEADSFSEQVGVESTSSWMEKKRNAWGWKKTEYELSPCGRSRVNTLWLPGGRESEKWHLCALLSLGEKKKKKTAGDTAALFLEFGSTDTRHARDSFADEGSNFEGPLDAVTLRWSEPQVISRQDAVPSSPPASPEDESGRAVSQLVE